MTAQFSELRKTGFELSRLVAVAGTATTVVAVRDKMGVYDSAKVHKAYVSRAELDAQFKQLANMPLEQRQSVVGLDPGRAPIIVAGLLIMQTVLDLAGVDVSRSAKRIFCMASSWMRRASRSAFGFAGRKTGTGPFSGIMATLSFLRRIGAHSNGGVAELAYAADLKSAAARLDGFESHRPTRSFNISSTAYL